MNTRVVLFLSLSFPIICCASQASQDSIGYCDEKKHNDRLIWFVDGDSCIVDCLKDCSDQCWKCPADDRLFSLKQIFAVFDNDYKNTVKSASVFVACVEKSKKKACCAHVGSIGALVIDKNIPYVNGEHNFLMPRHKVTEISEQKRITDADGRVWIGTAYSEPDCTKVEVSEDRRIMVIGSDEFWTKMYPWEVDALIRPWLIADKYDFNGIKNGFINELVAKKLNPLQAQVIDLLSDGVVDDIPVEQQKITINSSKENRIFLFLKNLSTTTKVLGGMSIAVIIAALSYCFYQQK